MGAHPVTFPYSPCSEEANQNSESSSNTSDSADQQHHARRGQPRYTRSQPQAQQARQSRPEVQTDTLRWDDTAGGMQQQSDEYVPMDDDSEAAEPDIPSFPYETPQSSAAVPDRPCQGAHRDEMWQSVRPRLMAAEVARAAIPQTPGMCSYCSNAAHIRCLDCTPCSRHAATDQLLCARCDRAQHPNAHLHRRHVHAAGCWEPLQPRQELTDEQEIV